jgi:hypothetical protein
MITQKYSSGLVAESFWFIEFKDYLKLKRDNLTDDKIKYKIIQNNLFGAPNENRARRVYGYIKRRADSLDKNAIELFFNSDLSTQRLFNLVCILRNSRIFFEFINEVYREKIILGIETLETSDIRIFFNNKMVQSEEISNWKEPTLKRIQGSFITILTESKLLIKRGNNKHINPPIVDILFEKYLEANGETDIIKAMTGAY